MTEIANKPKRYLTWQEFDLVIDKAAEQLESCEISGIYGIPRGGLTLAVALSHRLGVPMLAAPCKNCIVVDDIADTGITLQHFEDCNYATLTWCYKPDVSKVRPNYYYLTCAENEWIVFPWESK